MEETDPRKKSNDIILYSILGGIIFVIVIFLISIPTTKKKYKPSSTTTTTDGITEFQAVIKPLSEFVGDGKYIRMRSIGTGQYYKTGFYSLDNCTGINTDIVNDAGAAVNAEDSDYIVSFVTGAGPFNEQGYPSDEPAFTRVLGEYDVYYLEKYSNPVKPADLTQQEYDELIADGYYIMPLGVVGSLAFSFFQLKPYLIGYNALISASLVNSNPTDPYLDWLFNTPINIQAAMDSALDYRNVFRFVRAYDNDNAFILETVLNPGYSYEVTRNVLAVSDPKPLLSNINPEGKFSTSSIEVSRVYNNFCVAMPERSYTEKSKVAFYIEEGTTF